MLWHVNGRKLCKRHAAPNPLVSRPLMVLPHSCTNGNSNGDSLIGAGRHRREPENKPLICLLDRKRLAVRKQGGAQRPLLDAREVQAPVPRPSFVQLSVLWHV